MEENKNREKPKNLTQKEKYNRILDKLIDKIGGKEWCLKQLIPEFEYREFALEYRHVYRNYILDQIRKNFYDSMEFIENNFVDVDVSNALWTSHIMRLYLYDQVNHRFFDFSVRTHQVEEVSLFEACEDEDEDGNTKTYPRSFFSKLKNGNSLWEKYGKILEENQMTKHFEKMQKNRDHFLDKMKKFKLIDSEDFEELEAKKAPEQYDGGMTRFVHDDIFYYQLEGIDGYITFNDGNDIMLEPSFAKVFYEKVVEQLRDT